ncbi:unnamed protein product, partial [marine sediment metagenome]
DWKKHVIVDEKLYRPADVGILKGDYSKAKKALDWQPATDFEDLVTIMLKVDCAK